MRPAMNATEDPESLSTAVESISLSDPSTIRTAPRSPHPVPQDPPSREAPEAMASLLNAIAEPTLEDGAELAAVEEDDLTRHHRRVHFLTRVRTTLDQMYWSHADLRIRAAEVLADRSRAPDWRLPYGEAGVLAFYLDLLSVQGHPHDLVRHALRLIGNSCADTDDNRRRVVDQDYLPAIIHQLHDPHLVPVALGVIYNICLDYEPAQRQALELGLLGVCVGLLSDQTLLASGQNVIESTCRLIDLLIASPQAVTYAPENAVDVLLKTASSQEIELGEFVALVDLAVAHLANARFQQLLISHQSVEGLLSALVESYSRFTNSEDALLMLSDLGLSMDAPQPPQLEENRVLSLMRRGAIDVLSDISALPEFGSMYPLDSCLIGSLRLWLTVPQTQLQVCACLMLGNLARTDSVCWIMVHDFKIHETLIRIVSESDQSSLLHAATGFLKNLALLAANKEAIGAASLFASISRLWAMETLPQIQYSGASVARQAVSGSYRNIQRLLAPLSPDPDSPAHSRTYLSLVLHLDRTTDQAATKAEVARTITAILRVLSGAVLPASADEVAETQRRLYQLHPDIARPLSVQACQDQWTVARSEAWFTFALMARDKVGAAAVDDALTEVDLLRVLMEIVTGKRIGGDGAGGEDAARPGAENVPEGGGEDESPARRQELREMKRVERENALVLISRLLDNRGNDMPAMRREIFRNILHGKEQLHQSFTQLLAATARQPDSLLPYNPPDADDDDNDPAPPAPPSPFWD